jgi:hypothetical protein
VNQVTTSTAKQCGLLNSMRTSYLYYSMLQMIMKAPTYWSYWNMRMIFYRNDIIQHLISYLNFTLRYKIQLRFSQQWIIRAWYSGLHHHVVWYTGKNVLVEPAVFIFCSENCDNRFIQNHMSCFCALKLEAIGYSKMHFFVAVLGVILLRLISVSQRTYLLICLHGIIGCQHHRPLAPETQSTRLVQRPD